MIASLSVTHSVQQAFDQFFGYLPNILGFLVILVIGYVIARVVRSLVGRGLGHLRIDERVSNSAAGRYVDGISPGGRPSRLIAAVVFWFIFLYVLTAAIGALNIPSVTTFMNQVLDYLPNVIAAVLIFVVAAAISAGVATAARRTMGDTPTGKLSEAVVPGLIMAIAMFMILEQLRIATNIVVITYAALVGMLALTGALAFGLGGREVAGRLWSQAYESGRQAKDQASVDLRQARARAQQEMDRVAGATDAPSGARPFRTEPGSSS